MAKRGPLDVHILCTLVGCSVVVLHSRAHAETSLPISSTLVYGFLIKAFKVEKRLISTLLPLGVGALIAHEQKIKWNYLSSDTRQRDSGKMTSPTLMSKYLKQSELENQKHQPALQEEGGNERDVKSFHLRQSHCPLLTKPRVQFAARAKKKPFRDLKLPLPKGVTEKSDANRAIDYKRFIPRGSVASFHVIACKDP